MLKHASIIQHIKKWKGRSDKDTMTMAYADRGVPEDKFKVRRGWIWEGDTPCYMLEKNNKI